MIQKTKNYSQFVFRNDNRAQGVSEAHVRKLMDSISSRNMLQYKPIDVNSKMEIIDGQHRLIAAQSLGLDIYYRIDKESQPHDIILMNIQKTWTNTDFLNYYCKNGFEEYLKLQHFMDANRLSLRIALSLTMGYTSKEGHKFKIGEYKFHDENLSDQLSICWYTIEYIKKMNNNCNYTSTAKFWKALLKLVNHGDFEFTQWRNNLEKMIERFGVRPTCDDYLKMMKECYNWKSMRKVNFDEDE